jgi:uncharacterized protein
MNKSHKKTFFSILLLLGIAVVAFFVLQRNVDQVKNPVGEYSLYKTTGVDFKGSEYIAYVVDTPRLRSRGLSNKSILPQDEGMLFVFEEEGIYPFWMQDMNFDIDIVWLDAGGNVVYVVQNAMPESYPNLFTPTQEALYVWEVNAGFVAEKGIDIGGRVEIDL